MASISDVIKVSGVVRIMHRTHVSDTNPLTEVFYYEFVNSLVSFNVFVSSIGHLLFSVSRANNQSILLYFNALVYRHRDGVLQRIWADSV